MKIKVARKITMVVAGRAGACCASCCAPVGVN
ncbi:methanobactin [Lysobacter pythonis]|uniref:Methanobactin n=1 Tax=Solilutibacter pythonis TaxID=2483112 RepID=A0A3M2I5T2_9GAMM|nr:methanobactin [Lysobacter pythonis]